MQRMGDKLADDVAPPDALAGTSDSFDAHVDLIATFLDLLHNSMVLYGSSMSDATEPLAIRAFRSTPP